IPLKVLLGTHYQTHLAIDSVQLAPARYTVSTTPGTFLALDCDTSGTVLIAGKYALDQNVPNPFNPSTIIPYEIARTQRVTINLYNSMGTLVKVLLDETVSAGPHQFRLDAISLPTGIFTYELISGPFRRTRRMVIVE